MDIVSALANNTPAGERLLPSGYGISVNTPYITSLDNDSCVAPPFYHTRMNGGAVWDVAVEEDGVFTYAPIVPERGGNACINGDCSLPGETGVVEGGCASSVSVFTVDYDAPLGEDLSRIRGRTGEVVKYMDGTGSESDGDGSECGQKGHGGGHHWGPPPTPFKGHAARGSGSGSARARL